MMTIRSFWKTKKAHIEMGDNKAEQSELNCGSFWPKEGCKCHRCRVSFRFFPKGADGHKTMRMGAQVKHDSV